MDSHLKQSQRNDLLKEQRLQRGWSQAQAAEELSQLCEDKPRTRESSEINDKMIGRWERGEHLPNLYYQRKLSLLYGKSLQELGFIIARETRDERAKEPLPTLDRLPSHVSEPIHLTPHQAIDLLSELPHAPAEQQLGAWLALGAGDLATLCDEGWSPEEVLTTLRIVLQGVQAMPHISRRTFGRRMRELITAALVSQLPIPTGEHLTAEERTRLHQALGEQFAAGWQLFHTAGNAQVLAVSQAHLYLVQHVQAHLYPNVQSIFYAGIYRLKGAALFFQGRYEEAQQAQRSAYAAALEGADAWNMAQSRTWQVYGYQALDQHDQAIQAIVSALRLTTDHDDEASRRLHSHLLACWAESALARQEIRVSEEKLEASASFLDAIQPNEEFDRSHWLQIAGNCALARADYATATKHLEESLAALSPHWLMRQAVTLLPLATAYARSGDRAKSVEIARQAVGVLSAPNAPIMTNQLDTYLRHDLFERYRDDASVRTFLREVGRELPQTGAALA